jgi:Cd2+/Zn2+-exporting ATPase
VTEHTLDLPLLLPREAECAACVDELLDALGGLDGVRGADADLARGLVHVQLEGGDITAEEFTRAARRAGALAHCAEHCPFGDHDHGARCVGAACGDTRLESRLLHVAGLDCPDCALKLERSLGTAPGVAAARLDFGAATLKIEFDPAVTDAPRLVREIERHGYRTVEGADEPRSLSFAVTGMDCADCARRLESRVAAVDGVREARVDFGLARLTATLDGEAAIARIHRAAGELGYSLASSADDKAAPRRRPWRVALTAASGAFVVAGFSAPLWSDAARPWLFAAAMVLGGGHIARAAFFSLRARQVDMNVLMTLAVVGAAAIGQWSEGALTIFLFSLGTSLQAATLERTRRAIRALIRLAPSEARLVDASGERTVPLEALVPGDLLRLRPGERLPVDGTVQQGGAAVNEAAVTGESLPVAKAPGDHVFAGSIVEGGSLVVQATSGAADNTIAKIIHLVEEAQAQRAPVQSIVDRFAARYTPAVVALAALVAVLPPALGAPLSTWVYRALALLIISCPCALVISTPVSILAALTKATRRGILVKGGAYLEQAARIKVVALDKTGTITAGRPTVADIVALDGVTERDLLAMAAGVERGSEHPLAAAILARADADGIAVPASDRFRAMTGKGARADVGGRTVMVGRPELFGAAGTRPRVTELLARLEADGRTAVLVGTPEKPSGAISVADPVRTGARDALAALRALGVERIVMLTGDNEATARATAVQVGIDEVRAGLLPAEKVDAVRELQERYGPLMMVGDGVNDAPALAAASVGVAMGAAGTDAALETADVGLMGDDLGAVAALIALSRRSSRIIRQNIAVSVLVKAVFLVLAPLGLATLWMAVFADMGTSLAVTANGLRLQR